MLYEVITAAIVLAEGFAGSEQAYLLRMNETARRLGLGGSHFHTVNGWPDEGKTYVTARDLVTLAQAMIRNYPDLYHRYSGKKRMDRITSYNVCYTKLLRLAEHLRHDCSHGDAACQRVAMFAVGGDDRVAFVERLHDADRDRLFSVVEVEESPYLLSLVEFGALTFKLANAQHLLEQALAMGSYNFV